MKEKQAFHKKTLKVKMKDWFVKNFILVSILFIAALLRLSFFTAYPPGLTNDEVGEVYSAYSISQTGRDVFGHNYPPPLFQSRRW